MPGLTTLTHWIAAGAEPFGTLVRAPLKRPPPRQPLPRPAQLILVDFQTQRDIGRREMVPHERYRLYEDCREHELLIFNSGRYRIDRAAWNPAKEEMMVQVTFDSWEQSYCDC